MLVCSVDEVHIERYVHQQGPRSDFVIGGLASAKRELLLGGSGGMPPVKF